MVIIINKDASRVLNPTRTNNVSIPSLTAAKNPNNTCPKEIPNIDKTAPPNQSHVSVPAVILSMP
ncbi:uncharacterized protein METZ01_LOCUS52990 [marine metagenome]|uniref:Uncharacterized protein n=1 Tax=marine metagenome TaxID=408172 RepID=A0A381S7U7_9ZZZZ